MPDASPSTSRFRAVEQFIEQTYISSGRLAGAQLVIQHHGAVRGRCFGHLDREATRPMASDTIFRIFSMTKPVTAVATMMLVERGLVRLQDPVARFIPSWNALQIQGQPVRQPMRVVDLLTHCSGLTAGFQHRTEIVALYRRHISLQPDGPPLREFVEALSRLPLEFEPGSAWNYSVASDVLGFIIEVASGRSFREFLSTEIFDPLGMRDTDFHVPPAKRARLAECYVCRPEELLGTIRSTTFDGDKTATPTFYSGGGGLLSTTRDYLAFANVVLNQGERGPVPLLSPSTWKSMSENRLPGGGDLPGNARGWFSDAGYTGTGFGLGWATTIDPANAVLAGSRGDVFWSGMANTFFWCDPAEQLIGIFMTQILPAEVYPLQAQIRRLTYEALRT